MTAYRPWPVTRDRSRFTDRADAGRQLIPLVEHLRGSSTVVVGLPRGGVPIASQIADALGAPLDVIIVRKLGVPFQSELAMGAIGEDGVQVLNEDIIADAHVTPHQVVEVIERERAELARRVGRFRFTRPRTTLSGRVVLIVDDGVATGSTALAACQVARAEGAERVVLAVPVAPPDWTDRLAGAADEFICIQTPSPFFGVGQFYDDFRPVTDDEVVACLNRSPAPMAAEDHVDAEVVIGLGADILEGHFTVGRGAMGVVVFAHGSGSSRHSPRNREVAAALHRAGFGTLLFDLLPLDERSNGNAPFDVELLARRLTGATAWIAAQPSCAGLPVGYFGASTGAAVALVAAADPASKVAAVVSRGGRPDLAATRLAEVRAPTLFIVGGRDEAVLGLNEEAQRAMHCKSELVIVPGAGHLFEERATMDEVSALATGWFLRNLIRPGSM